MIYTLHDQNSVTTISFSGSIILDKVVRIQKEILSLAEKPGNDMVIDLEKVDYIDSTGIGLFLKLSGMQKKRGKSFRVINISSRVAKILELSSLVEPR